MPESDKDNKEILEFQNIGKDHDHYKYEYLNKMTMKKKICVPIKI